MADGDTTIRIKTTADNSGAVQTEREFERLKAKAKEMGRASSDAAKQASAGMGGLQRAVGKVRAALTGFGFASLILEGVNAIRAFRDRANEAAEATTKLGRETAKAADAARVRELADGYRQLSEAIAATQAAQKEANDLINEEVRLRREAEAAALDLEEQKALAAVDPNSATAAEQRAAISARFAGQRASSAASNKKEDIILQRQALGEESRTAAKAADQLEGTLGADRAAISRARLGYRTNLQLSTMGNAADKDYLSLRYWREGKTDAGDAERERQKKEAAEAKEEVRKLEADLAAKEKRIAELRAQAANAEKRRDLLGGALDTANVAGEAAAIKSGLASDAAGTALAAKEEKVAAAAAERQRLTAEVASGASQADYLRGQIAFHQRRYGEAAETQARAGFAVETAPKSGLDAAQNAKYQADRTVAAISSTIAELTAKLKAVESALKQNRSRLASAKEDVQ